MEYLRIKNSDLSVSRLCMGGCPMGGYGWGDVQQQELTDAVNVAIDNGISFFDTADTYGLGESERILGKALGNRRQDVIIADKFGVRVENGCTFYDNSPSYIKRAIDLSLRNLGTDYIDIYQVHYRDSNTPLESVIEVLDELKKEGKIRYYGLSNVSEEDIKEIIPFVDKIVSVQNEYSLACRKNEHILNLLNGDYEITPLTWGSLGQGILTGKYDEKSTFGPNDRRSRDVYVNFHGEKLLRNLKIVDEMRNIADYHSKPVSAVAVRFILDWINNSVVLVGAKRPEQIRGSIAGMDWKLSEEELKILDNISQEKGL